MEETIKILIYIHAFFGGIGLIAGIGSVIVKKGSKLHKNFGKLFSIGMLTSSLISIPISWMPNHENIFLFLIGLFTIYLVLAGNRALTFKLKKKADWIDYVISGSMLLCSVVMLLIGIYFIMKSNSMGILFLFFGGFGLLLSIKDFMFYRNANKPKNAWLILHIGKMVGALIASITAFIVAGLGIGNLIAWTLPTLLGTVYIVYWKRKFKLKPAN
ncbi:hypothetical protein [Algibacter sp.]|uniref:hypothetical protein n=1 Tax=Algibacter sp. TaxID=1872428 RepID=UPI003C7646F1